MNKLVRSEDNDQLLGELGTLITLVDPHRLHKQAASNAMSRAMLAEHKPDKDHFMMHVIAMGDYDAYGFNRNADAFTKEANENYHHTFVDNGHFFREHNNDDPAKKIGDVVASIHNPEMHRTELAVWGHKKKASDVYDLIKSGDNVSVSMACHIDYDVDSITGKHCKSATEYEPHMRYRPGQYIPEFKKYAYVYNPHPRFFDISYVGRPADRIAHYLDYYLNEEGSEEHLKAASARGVVPGAFLAEAEGIKTAASLLNGPHLSPQQTAVLKKFASFEEEYHRAQNGQASEDVVSFVKQAADYAFRPEVELSDSQISSLRDLQPATLFTELGKRATVLPFYSFVSYVSGKPIEEVKKEASVRAAKSFLPKVFQDMMESCCVFDDGIFTPHEHSFMSGLDSANNDDVQNLMDKVTDDLTVAPGPCGSRTISIRIEFGGDRPADLVEPELEEKKPMEKESSQKARSLAHLYGLYKIAAVNTISDFTDYTLDNQMFMRLIAHNQI